jgi:5-methylcytosine-specific restriction endonuclease McrA
MSDKNCRVCQLVKPLEAFYARLSSKDGRRSDCRECFTKKTKEWEKNNPEKVKEYKQNCYNKNKNKYKKVNAKKQAERRASNPEKFRANYRKWYAANKDVAKAATLDWMSRNPGWATNYNKVNKEKIAKKNRDWCERNRSIVRERSRRYQAKKRGATPLWLTAIHKAQIQEMYDIAVALEVQTGMPYHVDHIHPLQGETCSGLHVPWNLQVLPRHENIAKSNKMIGEL